MKNTLLKVLKYFLIAALLLVLLLIVIGIAIAPVSYTHLTLPTIYSV